MKSNLFIQLKFSSEFKKVDKYGTNRKNNFLCSMFLGKWSFNKIKDKIEQNKLTSRIN